MPKWIHLKNSNSQFSHISRHNFLDGCRYVYIDIGTNIGIQIRKLYEPHLYPNAPVLPLFEQIFGNYSNEVCSVGFEANPLHDNYLKEFENYCLKHNWRVKIFTSTAVSIIETNLTFYTEPGNEGNNQWGASLEANGKKSSITVPSIDIVSWFKRVVLNRKIPSGFASSKVMMKSDIEGHDSTVIANLILNGVYCSIDLIYGEHLNDTFLKAISLLQQYSNSCKTKLIYMDDESYYTTRFPFIIHNSTN
ncbi:unnamed protein product [Rotaria sordida]|uniref:Methyltransferase FkbM domain-containing protein n=1 Tax=Rotaria sordida TaxID=392033 RepID=A0A816AU33_9BILA|nr:unnamed protein product [Rotaria sordida]CAF1600091.1 unnamed protein product [Rotaria sordida]